MIVVIVITMMGMMGMMGMMKWTRWSRRRGEGKQKGKMIIITITPTCSLLTLKNSPGQCSIHQPSPAPMKRKNWMRFFLSSAISKTNYVSTFIKAINLHFPLLRRYAILCSFLLFVILGGSPILCIALRRERQGPEANAALQGTDEGVFPSLQTEVFCTNHSRRTV